MVLVPRLLVLFFFLLSLALRKGGKVRSPCLLLLLLRPLPRCREPRRLDRVRPEEATSQQTLVIRCDLVASRPPRRVEARKNRPRRRGSSRRRRERARRRRRRSTTTGLSGGFSLKKSRRTAVDALRPLVLEDRWDEVSQDATAAAATVSVSIFLIHPDNVEARLGPRQTEPAPHARQETTTTTNPSSSSAPTSNGPRPRPRRRRRHSRRRAVLLRRLRPDTTTRARPDARQRRRCAPTNPTTIPTTASDTGADADEAAPGLLVAVAVRTGTGGVPPSLQLQVGRLPVQRELALVVVRVHVRHGRHGGVRAEEVGGRDGRHAVVHGALEEAALGGRGRRGLGFEGYHFVVCVWVCVWLFCL